MKRISEMTPGELVNLASCGNPDDDDTYTTHGTTASGNRCIWESHPEWIPEDDDDAEANLCDNCLEASV